MGSCVIGYQAERINREEKEVGGTRKGGEENARAQPPNHTSRHRVRRKESYVE